MSLWPWRFRSPQPHRRGWSRIVWYKCKFNLWNSISANLPDQEFHTALNAPVCCHVMCFKRYRLHKHYIVSGLSFPVQVFKHQKSFGCVWKWGPYPPFMAICIGIICLFTVEWTSHIPFTIGFRVGHIYIYFMNLNHPLVSVEIGVPPGNHRNTSPSLLRAPCLWHSRSGWSSFVRQPWCDVSSLSTSFYLCSWGKEDTWHCHAIEVHRLSCFLLRIVVLIVILPVFLLYLFSFFCSIVAI